ncbi:hypothetical protein [Nocardia brasiliensis]|uniref:hypothetical protein n=1 Tax=Nocardia brasiliensis TaxID=37326 RepID=UPI002457E2CC|nr:hypothetical protein [Nocardia brasiliensis]
MLDSPTRDDAPPTASARMRLLPRRNRAQRLEQARSAAMDFAAVPPDPARRAPLWHVPVPLPVPSEVTPPPLVWLLGAHGGAGVSTLERLLAPAADCRRQWPAVLAGESPYVLVVARETLDGLSRAHDLLRQWHSGGAGNRAHLLGLVTSAHQPGHMPAQIKRYLQVVEMLAPNRWRLDWQPDWPVTQLEDLPVWRPFDEPPAKGRDPLAAIRQLGDALVNEVRAIECAAPASESGTGSADPMEALP